jgi:recombinational DNA repair protein (RecF pathway)
MVRAENRLGHIYMQTRAFVLSSRPLNEYDRSYTLLVSDLGVIETFAKSVRRPNSKLSGHLEPPNMAWVELVESNRGWQIVSALEERAYREILYSPAALRSILQAGWLLREFVPISHPDPELWKLWEQFSKQLLRFSGSPYAVIRGVLAQFLIKLLRHLGFFPDPASITDPDAKLRTNVKRVLAGEWLEEHSCRDPRLWGAAKSAVKTAKHLMA